MEDCNETETITEEFCMALHRLLEDRNRLEQMVIETREEVNSVAPGGAGAAYDMTAENVSDRSYLDMVAFRYYRELFGKEALIE